MSANGASIEPIARGSSDIRPRTVYRHELRPVITEGAEIIGRIFQANTEVISTRVLDPCSAREVPGSRINVLDLGLRAGLRL